MKPLHALYLALAFIAIALLLVGEPNEGPLARMSGDSSPDRKQQSSASGAQQTASNGDQGFAYDPSDDAFDNDYAARDEFEYYGDEDVSAQADDDEDDDTPARMPRPSGPKFIIPKGSPPPVLSHSGARINRDEESYIERARP